METDPGLSLPFVMPPIDTDALASWFDSGFPLEFCFSSSFDENFVDSLFASGFIPMAAEDSATGSDMLLPKLHTARSAFAPEEARITKSARRDSRRYSFSFDRAFDEVLETCARVHGEDWLRPALRGCWKNLHDTRTNRRSRLVSMEIYEGDRLEAGEIGVFVGACYTSLSGFRHRSGSGTVQLAALGRFLEEVGARVWDLGMPLDYKQRLGARILGRSAFLELFRSAREGRVRLDGRATEPRDAWDLITRPCSPSPRRPELA